MHPRRGTKAEVIIGNGNNITAKAPTGWISSTIGSFDNVTGVTSESGQIGATGPMVDNAYTLQLNTNFFPRGQGFPAACQGWEQFVFANDGTSGVVIHSGTGCSTSALHHQAPDGMDLILERIGSRTPPMLRPCPTSRSQTWQI